MLREKMSSIGHNPPMRIAERGFSCLIAAVLAILCTLALAGSAFADEPLGTPTSTEAGEAQAPGEGQPGGSGGQSEETQGGVGAQQQETGQETPLGGGEASGGTGDSAGEEPAQAQTTGGESGENAPSSPGTGETTGQTSVETPVETPPVTGQTVQEPVKEVAVPKAEGLEGATGALLHASSADSGAAQDSATARAVATSETSGEPQALVAGPLSPPPTAPMAGNGEAQTPATPALSSGGGPRGAIAAALRAGALSCELSALGGHATDNCTVGWLGEKRFVGSSTDGFARVDGSLAAAITGGLPPGGGHGGSAFGNAPVSPTPGPPPGGASGGAAVGGASGLAPSAFLSLAGLLLLAAPRAMRRLRLSSRPWLTACFVLIPERPG